MKPLSLALATAVAMFVCGSVQAQEAENEKNIEYEKLKVLEPMIGTYQFPTATNEETGRVSVTRVTIAWSDSKKMLISEASWRAAETEADLAEQEWQPSQVRRYYAWNHAANRIENIFVRPEIGVVTISEVKHEGDNVFSFTHVSTTEARVGKFDEMYIVTKEGITYRMTNRENPAGEALEDAEWKIKRVKE